MLENNPKHKPLNIAESSPAMRDKPEEILKMDCELNLDALLANKIWIDEDGSYLPIWDIPTRKVYGIEKKLNRAVESGASEHIRKWYAVFVEEADVRRGMTQPD